MVPLLRTLLRSFVMAAVLVTGTGVLAWWYQGSSRWVKTENAYVKAQEIAISADVDGRVARVLAASNAHVEKGDLLFSLERKPFQIELDSGNAELAKVRQQIDAFRARYHLGELEIREAEERVRFAFVQHERHRRLQAEGTGTKMQLDEAAHELAMARARANVMRQRVAMAALELGGDPALPAERHPLFLKAKAARDQAALNLARSEIRAPATGYLSNMHLEPGEYVESGKPVFALVVADHPWIEANLKESQLTHVTRGQHASVVVDAYPDLTLDASVASISPATGAEFAVLPPQNATGNWVKVVQRIPVRLHVTVGRGSPPLRAGMTVTVRIDTGQERDPFSFVREVLAMVER